jgi:hypothetical protein
LVWGGTCVDTLCKSYISSTSRIAGAAAEKGEKKKKDLYSNLPSQYIFCPFAIETLGTFGEEILQLVNEIGGRLRNTIQLGMPEKKRGSFSGSALLFSEGTLRVSLPLPRRQ